MTPAHKSGQRRWIVLVVLALVLAGVTVAARSSGTSSPGGPPVVPAATVGAPDAESSAWYCTGQTTTAGGLAPGSVVLTNTGTRTVSGLIQAVTDTGATVQARVSVAARSQRVAQLPTPKTGTWLSEAITLSGGGVAVSQVLQGPSGWATAPCQSTTAQRWYFPSGVTTGSDALFVALFNPTSTPDVVDLSFATAKGVLHPINFQGIVLQSGQTQVESISPFVQDDASVATTVSTRTGRLVASELQLFSGNASGMAIVPGSPRTDREWALPENEEVSGGSSSIDVFNPGGTTQEVTVRTRLGSGPLTPFTARVLPDSLWVLATSDQTRIPKGDPYSAVIATRGGDGVVVGRTVIAPSSAPAPQAGLANAVDSLSAAPASGRWVVPALGSTSTPILAGVAPAHVALLNLTDKREKYEVEVMEPSGFRTVVAGDIAASGSVSLVDQALARAGLNPLIVSASGRAAVSQDLGPTGGYGVVTMQGMPLALALGG
jgi:hypothetical protein